MRKVKFSLLLLAVIMANTIVFYVFDEGEPILSETSIHNLEQKKVHLFKWLR